LLNARWSHSRRSLEPGFPGSWYSRVSSRERRLGGSPEASTSKPSPSRPRGSLFMGSTKLTTWLELGVDRFVW
jgi:hypothetical protein